MGEFLGSDFEIVEGFFTGEFAEQKKYNFPHQIITESELGRITTLMNNDSGVLLVRMKNNYLLCHPDAGRICPEKIS